MAKTVRKAGTIPNRRKVSGIDANVVSQSKQSIADEIGVTGLRYWGGRVDEEFLRELKWDQARKIYREMGENDPTVGAALNTVSWIIRSVPWRVESEQEEDPRAELIESAMDDMEHAWSELMSEIVRGTLQYGWQFHEVVYKQRDDGMVGWAKIPVRSQDSLYQWVFDDNGTATAMQQQAPPDYKIRTIPLSKGLLFRTESVKNSPEGRSVLRNAYRPWYFKRNIENIEGIGIERDLAGLPVGYAPAAWFTDADQTKLDAFKILLTNVRRDEQEGIAIPSLFDENGNRLIDLKLLTTGGTRQFDTTAIINRYDLRILQLVLADFIQLGHEKVGSFALSSDKTDIFAVAMGVFLDMIQSTFNRQAVPRLLEINGMDTEDAPQLVHGDLERQNLTELADFVQKLSAAGMGVFPNPRIEAKLYEMADLPVPTPEEQAATDAAVQQAAAENLANRLAQQNQNQPQDRPPEPTPAEAKKGWVTINGQHILIGEDGTIESGPMAGKTPDEAFGGESKPSGSKPHGSSQESDDAGFHKPANVDPAQRKAVGNYQGGAFSMNRALREQGGNAKTRAMIDRLDQVFEDTPRLQRNATVYRGLSDMDFSQIKRGSILSDRAYVSTSLNSRIAGSFSGRGGAVVEIHLPKGARALRVGNYTTIHAEQEVLLPRNSRFRVQSVSRSGGRWHIKAEPIGG